MTIVKRISGYIKDYDVVVKFSARSKEFTIELPIWTKDALGREYVQSDSLEGVERELKKAIDEFKAIKTISKKVILYAFKVKAIIHSYDEDGKIIKTLIDKNDISFAEGIALSLFFRVCIRHEYDGRVVYKTEEGTGVVGNNITWETPRGAKEMDWTQERQEFFEKLNKSLENIILKADKFFSSDVEKLMNFIDNGYNLLDYNAKNNTGDIK